MTDNEIIDGLLNNDRKVCADIVSRLRSPICQYTLKNKGNLQDGKDLFQITYMKALIQLRAGKYEQQYKFDAWFTRIARNTWLDHIKKKKEVKPHYVGDDDFLLESADESDEDSLLKLVLYDKRLECLSSVWDTWEDTICRRALDAFYFLHKKTKVIADEEGMTQNAILARLFNCKRKLFKLVSICLNSKPSLQQ